MGHCRRLRDCIVSENQRRMLLRLVAQARVTTGQLALIVIDIPKGKVLTAHVRSGYLQTLS